MTAQRIQTDYFRPRNGKGHYPVQVYVYYNRDQAIDKSTIGIRCFKSAMKNFKVVS